MARQGLRREQINWAAAQDFYDYCAASVTWRGANGPVTQPATSVIMRSISGGQSKSTSRLCWIALRLPVCEQWEVCNEGPQGRASVFSFNTAISSWGLTAVSSTFWAEMVDRSEVKQPDPRLFSLEKHAE
jgi:hypothetical protein